MQAIALKAEKRPETGRTAGMIPAICYGAGKENVSVNLDYQTFRKVFKVAGENTVIDLDIDGQSHKALVYDVQYHPISDQISHVDFKFIRMDEKVVTHVPIVFEGIAPAVKDLQGILTPHMHELEVRSLPANIPHEFKVDVSGIADFHTIIHVKDIALPDGVEVLGNLDDVVVNVAPPRVEEEIVTAEAEAAAIAELAKVPGAEGQVAAEGGSTPSPKEGGREEKKEKKNKD